MKYNKENVPLVCMMTNNKCYKSTKTFAPVGVLWHSTGANNKKVSRYVQPSDNAKDRAQILAWLGENKYKNDWNHTDRLAGMNAFIGELANGTVAAVQTMPWNYRPWGCGSGSCGSCNDTHIQFEICEDSLTDAEYTQIVYKEACELTAYLCAMYNIDPHGTIDYKGIKVPTILCHKDSANLKLGNDHTDVLHWFPKKIGKTMEDVRNDVAAIIAGLATSTPELSTLRKGSKGDAVKELQQALINKGYDLGKWGADGDFGTMTQNAVIKFQVDNDLIANGVADHITRTAILAADPTPAELFYTVHIEHVNKDALSDLLTSYRNVTYTQEPT